jgi:ABC-type proline/glycine betaine transport system ATPase subunit
VLYQGPYALEFDDARRECRLAAVGIHRSDAVTTAGSCVGEISAGRPLGFEDFYPSQISGAMQKRAGLARAMGLDPEVLFFDEPSARMDPISSRLLDDLILELRDSLGGDDCSSHSRTG